MRDLLMPLISLFLFTGCTNPNGIGLNNEDLINGTTVDTVTVVTQTVSDNPIRVDNNFEYNNLTGVNRFKLLGYYNDPVFGKSTADWYSQLQIPSFGFKFPAGTILDSAVLVLPYADTLVNNTFYGDVDSKFKLTVEQLGSAMKSDSIYYSNQTFNTDGTAPFASGFFKITPNTPIYVQDIRVGKIDTIKKDVAQIRVPLDLNFAKNVFVNADSSVYLTQAAFTAYFKGIKVKIDNTQTTGSGGLVYLNTSPAVADGGARIQFYYKTAKDTASVLFRINSAVAQTNHFTHTYTPELTNALSAGPNLQKAYIQSMAGIRTKISFPYLKNIAKNKKLLINKAELIFTVVGGTDPAPLRRIYINRGQNNKGEYIQIADGNATDPRFINDMGGYYNSTTKTYHLNLVRFVRDIIEGKTDDTNLYLTVDNPAIDGGRVVLAGSGSADSKPKLSIIYSDIISE
ncbi:protein of unknown function [Solitalea koreensis]|uniref:DUF4270 domain-containing protein n=2 Tax=Solitalea koreensis TaxID=543615 RepID=A0A521CFV6_9SPHI|nr:protein of unknown function [Solitalea koreensis]